MSDAMTVAERQCAIEEVFDPSFIELLKLVPATSVEALTNNTIIPIGITSINPSAPLTPVIFVAGYTIQPDGCWMV